MSSVPLDTLATDMNSAFLRAINDLLVYCGKNIDPKYCPPTWQPSMDALMAENKVAWITVLETLISASSVGKFPDLLRNYLPDADMDADFFDLASKNIRYKDKSAMLAIAQEIRVAAKELSNILTILEYVIINIDKMLAQDELVELFNIVMFYAGVLFQVYDIVGIALKK
jgi:hypothetical protein